MKSSAIGALKTRVDAELLLHPLGDVEDAALVPVRDVLAPDVGVGVVAELFLERLVERMYEGRLVARAVRDSVRPPFGRPGLGHDVLVDRRGVRLGRLARAIGGFLVGPFVLRLDRAQVFFGNEPGVREQLAEAGQRVRGARGGELLGRAVEVLPVRVGVRVDPHAARVDDGRPGAGAHERDGLAHGAERVEDVQAVAVDDLDVLVAGEVVRGVEVRGLVALGHRDAVPVVLHDEDDRELLVGGAVERLGEVALRERRLAHRGEHDRFLVVGLDRPGEARGVLGVVRHARRHVLDPDRGLGEVVGHVPAARGDVGRLRRAVQQDLLGGQARGEAGREVAVVGEEVVARRAERQAERELDRVMARAGRVVAPAETLLEIVGSLVVEHATEVHQRVPFLDLFPRDAGKARLSRGLGDVLSFRQPGPPRRHVGRETAFYKAPAKHEGGADEFPHPCYHRRRCRRPIAGARQGAGKTSCGARWWPASSLPAGSTIPGSWRP